MTVNLIKVAVGIEKISGLETRQADRLQSMKRNREKQELIHITRYMPRRAQEVLEGGSLYWVIKGWLCARQKILELRPVMRNDVLCCGLVYDKKIVRVSPRPHRPFQGWRYLTPSDAPPDLAAGTSDEDFPETLMRDLAELGLL